MQQAPYQPVLFSKELTEKIRIGIVRSLFNTELTQSLEIACRDTLGSFGVKEENLAVHTVPGALEIPVVAQAMAATKRFDVLIALGVIIKGDTYHFELVADECARGCMDVALSTQTPVIMEVLAAYNLAQATIRCSNDGHNKGIEAAFAALQVYESLSAVKISHVQ